MSKTEEEILSKQQYIDRLKEKESEIVINLQVLVAHGQSKRLFFFFFFLACVFFFGNHLTYNTRYSTYNTLLAATYLQYTSQYSQYITYNNLLLLSIHVTLLTINPLQEIIYNTLLF